MSSKLLVCLATKFGLTVQHHKPECPVEKCGSCAQGQGHVKVQNVNVFQDIF